MGEYVFLLNLTHHRCILVLSFIFCLIADQYQVWPLIQRKMWDIMLSTCPPSLWTSISQSFEKGAWLLWRRPARVRT